MENVARKENIFKTAEGKTRGRQKFSLNINEICLKFVCFLFNRRLIGGGFRCEQIIKTTFLFQQHLSITFPNRNKLKFLPISLIRWRRRSFSSELDAKLERYKISKDEEAVWDLRSARIGRWRQFEQQIFRH